MIHMTKRHLSGLRMSVAIGIILPVAAEMIGPELGVGAYILLPGCLAATEKN
jgi:NitT/TauT family transport system permease protein